MRSYLIVTLIPVLCLSLAACEETLVSPNLADTDPVMAEGASKKPGGKPGPNDFPTVVSFEVKIFRPPYFPAPTPVPVTTDPDLLAALLLDETDLLRSDESQVSLAFFGCPDANRVCNELTLVLSGGGTSDRISVLAEPSVQGCLAATPLGGCVYDMDLGNRRNAASWSQRVLPVFPLNAVAVDAIDGTRTFTLYWQGQRKTTRDNPDGTRDKVWDRYPDLDFVDQPDYFVFSFGRSNDKSGGVFGRTYADCIYGDGVYRPCWAEFHGAGGRKAYAVGDAFQFGTSGKGKKAKKTFRFELQSFSTNPADLPKKLDGSINYLDPVVVVASLATWHTVMMTDPSGVRSIVLSGGSGVNPGDPEKPGIHKSDYSVSLSSGEGCYAFRLLDGHVYYSIADLDYVWDSTKDFEGAQTVWADTISGTITVGGTTCPAS